VEPIIALSITFVALENLVARGVRPRRIFLVFAFGLLHGLGFAGVLTELRLPRDCFVHALAGFNIGVEAGQLLVVASAYALAAPLRQRPGAYRRFVVTPSSLAIGLIGVVWTIGRL
jgi:hypothetical protein